MHRAKGPGTTSAARLGRSGTLPRPRPALRRESETMEAAARGGLMPRLSRLLYSPQRLLYSQYNSNSAGYNSISAGYNSIAGRYNSITAHYNSITAHYNSITAHCNSITAGYNSFTAHYNSLAASYNSFPNRNVLRAAEGTGVSPLSTLRTPRPVGWCSCVR